jgi:signal transduction histidine kinase
MNRINSRFPAVSESGGVISADRETSDLLHQVAELRAHQAELVGEVARLRALAAVGEGAASIAHEIRNPLGAISGFSELLVRRCESHPELRDMAAKIMTGTLNLSSLVQRLLDFVRDTPMEMRPIDWSRFVQTSVDQYEENARHRGARITLVRKWGENLGAGEADALCLRQALWNVLENAEQASGTDKPIEVDCAPSGNGGLRLIVADRGQGINPDVLARVFTSFVTTREGGTGLGLAMARKIVERHGGKIAIHNRDGGGAEVRIALPAPGAPSLLLSKAEDL